MKKLFMLGWLLLVMACGGDSTGPVSIAGPWTLSGNYSNSSIQISCQFSGGADVSQTGGTFTGSYAVNETCSGPGGVISGFVTGLISGGQITGNSVGFWDDGGCQYTGSVSGNRMSGPSSCILAVAGSTYHFSGSWSASQ